jgi:hypothetical protein
LNPNREGARAVPNTSYSDSEGESDCCANKDNAYFTEIGCWRVNAKMANDFEDINHFLCKQQWILPFNSQRMKPS